MVFGQLVMPVPAAAGAPTEHCTGMTNWPSTIQCLDLMSLGMKSFATEIIHDGFLDSPWVPGFTIGSWIHDRFLDL